MDRLTTFYIHTGDKGEQGVAKGVINLTVMKGAGSLVAWYPSLGDDGLQGCYMTDGDVITINETAGKVETILANLGIQSNVEVREIVD